jgi:uncharacterized protein (DUF2267 family)
VQYEEFITAAADRSGLPREDAERLVHATLRVLAERISGGEAEDLKAQMPKPSFRSTSSHRRRRHNRSAPTSSPGASRSVAG